MRIKINEKRKYKFKNADISEVCYQRTGGAKQNCHWLKKFLIIIIRRDYFATV